MCGFSVQVGDFTPTVRFVYTSYGWCLIFGNQEDLWDCIFDFSYSS